MESYTIEHSLINFFKLIPDVCERLSDNEWDWDADRDLETKISFACEDNKLDSLMDWLHETFDNGINLETIWHRLFYSSILKDGISSITETDYYVKLLDLKENDYVLSSFAPKDDSNTLYYDYLDICKYYFDDCLLAWYDDYTKRQIYEIDNECYPSSIYEANESDKDYQRDILDMCNDIIAMSKRESNPYEYIAAKLRQLRDDATPEYLKGFWACYYEEERTIEEELANYDDTMDGVIKAYKSTSESEEVLSEKTNGFIEVTRNKVEKFYEAYKKVVYLDAYLEKQKKSNIEKLEPCKNIQFTQNEFKKHFTMPFQNKEYNDVVDDDGVKTAITRFDSLQATIKENVPTWNDKQIALLAYKIWRSPFFTKTDYHNKFAKFLRDFHRYCGNGTVMYKPKDLIGHGDFTGQFYYLDE